MCSLNSLAEDVEDPLHTAASRSSEQRPALCGARDIRAADRDHIRCTEHHLRKWTLKNTETGASPFHTEGVRFAYYEQSQAAMLARACAAAFLVILAGRATDASRRGTPPCTPPHSRRSLRAGAGHARARAFTHGGPTRKPKPRRDRCASRQRPWLRAEPGTKAPGCAGAGAGLGTLPARRATPCAVHRRRRFNVNAPPRCTILTGILTPIPTTSPRWCGCLRTAACRHSSRAHRGGRLRAVPRHAGGCRHTRAGAGAEDPDLPQGNQRGHDPTPELRWKDQNVRFDDCCLAPTHPTPHAPRTTAAAAAAAYRGCPATAVPRKGLQLWHASMLHLVAPCCTLLHLVALLRLPLPYHPRDLPHAQPTRHRAAPVTALVPRCVVS